MVDYYNVYLRKFNLQLTKRPTVNFYADGWLKNYITNSRLRLNQAYPSSLSWRLESCDFR